ncbi:MAG: hypothetical protein FD129_3176, partial [bacterium]
MGSIEDRTQALQLLEDIRHVYDGQTRYHRDRAAIYESCQQPSQARQSYGRLVDLDPEDVEARVAIARLWLQELLYHYDLSLTSRMLASLRPALALQPDHRDALYYSSLALGMAAGLPREESPAMSRQGMAQARRILERDSTDLAARMLLAVHCMDLGQFNDAAAEFDLALAQSPADIRAAFQTTRWTAPVSALKALETRDAEGRASYDRAYWR